MAGEMFVAAQLQRLGVFASVTYGNAKRADVVCTSRDGERAVVIEVKTSSRGRWPIGSRVPELGNQIWVFVYLPTDDKEPPRFFIWTQDELHTELRPKELAYMERYKKVHGQEYGDRPGVAALNLKEAIAHEGAWEKVLERLG